MSDIMPERDGLCRLPAPPSPLFAGASVPLLTPEQCCAVECHTIVTRGLLTPTVFGVGNGDVYAVASTGGGPFVRAPDNDDATIVVLAVVIVLGPQAFTFFQAGFYQEGEPIWFYATDLNEVDPVDEGNLFLISPNLATVGTPWEMSLSVCDDEVTMALSLGGQQVASTTPSNLADAMPVPMPPFENAGFVQVPTTDGFAMPPVTGFEMRCGKLPAGRLVPLLSGSGPQPQQETTLGDQWNPTESLLPTWLQQWEAHPILQSVGGYLRLDTNVATVQEGIFQAVGRARYSLDGPTGPYVEFGGGEPWRIGGYNHFLTLDVNNLPVTELWTENDFGIVLDVAPGETRDVYLGTVRTLWQAPADGPSGVVNLFVTEFVNAFQVDPPEVEPYDNQILSGSFGDPQRDAAWTITFRANPLAFVSFLITNDTDVSIEMFLKWGGASVNGSPLVKSGWTALEVDADWPDHLGTATPPESSYIDQLVRLGPTFGPGNQGVPFTFQQPFGPSRRWWVFKAEGAETGDMDLVFSWRQGEMLRFYDNNSMVSIDPAYGGYYTRSFASGYGGPTLTDSYNPASLDAVSEFVTRFAVTASILEDNPPGFVDFRVDSLRVFPEWIQDLPLSELLWSWSTTGESNSWIPFDGGETWATEVADGVMRVDPLDMPMPADQVYLRCQLLWRPEGNPIPWDLGFVGFTAYRPGEGDHTLDNVEASGFVNGDDGIGYGREIAPFGGGNEVEFDVSFQGARPACFLTFSGGMNPEVGSFRFIVTAAWQRPQPLIRNLWEARRFYSGSTLLPPAEDRPAWQDWRSLQSVERRTSNVSDYAPTFFMPSPGEKRWFLLESVDVDLGIGWRYRLHFDVLLILMDTGELTIHRTGELASDPVTYDLNTNPPSESVIAIIPSRYGAQ